MTALVHAALSVRRGARASFGTLAAAALGLLVLLGVFRERAALGYEHLVIAVAWCAVFGARATARIRDERRGQGGSWLDLELSLLLYVAVQAALQMLGGITGAFVPALYVFIAFVSSYGERRSVHLLLLVAMAFDAALYFLTEGRTDVRAFAMHAIFIALFGVLNVLFTHAEIRRVRRQSERALADDKERIEADAHLFRFAATPTDSAARDDDKLFRSSVHEVHQSLLYNLSLLKRVMGLHSCVLLMHDDGRDWLRIVELVTDSDDIAEGPFPLAAGAVGAAYQRGVVMNLEHLKPGYQGICYYDGPAVVRAFMAVPVLEGDRPVGVLCADRLEDRPFEQAEQDAVVGAVSHLLRTLENERVFVQLERSKREHSVLHRASRALGAARTEQDVLDAGLEAASEIVPHDFAAVTQYDPATRQHSIRRAVGEGAEQLANLSFRDNASLTAMAVKNRHYLPYRGEFDSGSQVVYTKKANLAGMESLLILPLIVGDRATGTLALASTEPDVFRDSMRPALQSLANQMAVALSNAASLKRLEELATTDGLTGCYNKRYFNDELTSRLHAAQRFGRKLSLVITDIDHFKTVNDTYGHATGDIVIRELGSILKRLKRETDVVARFGGEEFCVLCEETDAEGAVQLAERVRSELEQTVFETEVGKLAVTCSLGVATYPDGAPDREALFSTADRALYAAKHQGRNQVCTA